MRNTNMRLTCSKLLKHEVEQYLTAKKWAVVQQELPFDENTPGDISPDTVDETPLDFLQKVAEETGATLTVNGKRVKPRQPRRKKVKEPAA